MLGSSRGEGEDKDVVVGIGRFGVEWFGLVMLGFSG